MAKVKKEHQLKSVADTFVAKIKADLLNPKNEITSVSMSHNVTLVILTLEDGRIINITETIK